MYRSNRPSPPAGSAWWWWVTFRARGAKPRRVSSISRAFPSRRCAWCMTDEALKNWAGQLTGPVAIYDDEAPRAGWAEILMLAERLAPTPALLPLEPNARGHALIIADKICSPGGLAWTRRLQSVHGGLHNTGDFRRALPDISARNTAMTRHRPRATGSVCASCSARSPRPCASSAPPAGLLPRRYVVRRRRLQRHLHGPLQAFARSAVPHGSRHSRRAGASRRRHGGGAGSDPARTSRHDVCPASGVAAVALIRREPIPDRALHAHYARQSAYLDCYATDIDRAVTFEEFIVAFYSTWLFKLERWILAWSVGRPRLTNRFTSSLADAVTPSRPGPWKHARSTSF